MRCGYKPRAATGRANASQEQRIDQHFLTDGIGPTVGCVVKYLELICEESMEHRGAANTFKVCRSSGCDLTDALD